MYWKYTDSLSEELTEFGTDCQILTIIIETLSRLYSHVVVIKVLFMCEIHTIFSFLSYKGKRKTVVAHNSFDKSSHFFIWLTDEQFSNEDMDTKQIFDDIDSMFDDLALQFDMF